jgi:hypothetical protein
VGVVFCSAIHAALWAPLTTLGRQSLLGAFQSVCVPRLPEDAAFAMMRGLGARQGIRFTDQALALIVREAQEIPILVRRVGSSVLELYDPERARQVPAGGFAGRFFVTEWNGFIHFAALEARLTWLGTN